eukprot:GHVU01134631.1.p1 GENE.GHVU01134631.1~~GHVU01134631.1.p1  ORF type:complete len:130 (-),score=19.05 GHVU01134631.1:41-430(-)
MYAQGPSKPPAATRPKTVADILRIPLEDIKDDEAHQMKIDEAAALLNTQPNLQSLEAAMNSLVEELKGKHDFIHTVLQPNPPIEKGSSTELVPLKNWYDEGVKVLYTSDINEAKRQVIDAAVQLQLSLA